MLALSKSKRIQHTHCHPITTVARRTKQTCTTSHEMAAYQFSASVPDIQGHYPLSFGDLWSLDAETSYGGVSPSKCFLHHNSNKYALAKSRRKACIAVAAMLSDFTSTAKFGHYCKQKKFHNEENSKQPGVVSGTPAPFFTLNTAGSVHV